MDSARESGPADVLPIAVLGYSIRLPQGINSGEDLFTAVREKRQLIAHRDESGYPLPAVCDDGTEGVGKYRPLRGNYTTWQEGRWTYCMPPHRGSGWDAFHRSGLLLSLYDD